MSARSASRAASGAKRSGAAALLMYDFRHAHDDCGVTMPCLPFYFAPAPARWFQRRLWWRPGGPCSSPPVLRFSSGQGGRTANPLETCGSAVPFWRPSRMACVCMHLRLRDGSNVQNHRTIELFVRNGRNTSLSRGRSVLVRFCGSGANKIVGGYAALVTEVVPLGDPHLIGGASRRNFPGQNALAGADLAIGARVQAAGKNGGFLPFSRGVRGVVGMASSECSVQSIDDAAFSGAVQKPFRLSAPIALGGKAGGLIGSTEGVEPPIAPALSYRMLAQPIFRVSFDNRIGRSEAEALSFDPRNGSGLGKTPCPPASARSALRKMGPQDRVGDAGNPGWRVSPNGEGNGLSGGRHHVNA